MSIILEQLTKRYDGHPVVNNVSLEVGDGEFFVLLGSSGSGKTTVLSIIAGLTGVDQGRVMLHGRDVTHLPTQQRRVGFVFQNYALFQHMTVAENIEFGLSVRKMPRAEQRRRSDELLELVGLTGLGSRMPRQISGGQQQRVALARALAYQPDVLLLDEPLGALDAKIRVELRRTLREIQRRLKVTTILVTHDQEEAFDLADRMGVMSFGRLLEVGVPEELYQRPKTEFVATFLGTANLLVGQTTGKGVQLGPLNFPLPEPDVPTSVQAAGERRVQVLFRPEDIALASNTEELDCPQLGQAEVEETNFSGSYQRLRLRMPPVPGVRPIAPPVAFGSNAILVEATRPPDQAERFPLQAGDRAWVGVRRIHALANPGLSFLIVIDGSPQSAAALEVGGQIARMVQARVTLLGCGQREDILQQHLQEARKVLGGGLAALDTHTRREPPAQAVRNVVEQRPVDVVILGFRPHEDTNLAEHILEAGEHHLLLVPVSQAAPSRALICVVAGEPGKDDVFFAGRLISRLGGEATLLSVISPLYEEDALRAERFLARGAKTLGILNVSAKTKVRSGLVKNEILDELLTGSHDLLVMGAPLASILGEVSLDGVVRDIISSNTQHPTLIVRSHFVGAKIYPITEAGSKDPTQRRL